MEVQRLDAVCIIFWVNCYIVMIVLDTIKPIPATAAGKNKTILILSPMTMDSMWYTLKLKTLAGHFVGGGAEVIIKAGFGI